MTAGLGEMQYERTVCSWVAVALTGISHGVTAESAFWQCDIVGADAHIRVQQARCVHHNRVAAALLCLHDKPQSIVQVL